MFGADAGANIWDKNNDNVYTSADILIQIQKTLFVPGGQLKACGVSTLSMQVSMLVTQTQNNKE